MSGAFCCPRAGAATIPQPEGVLQGARYSVIVQNKPSKTWFILHNDCFGGEMAEQAEQMKGAKERRQGNGKCPGGMSGAD